MKKFIIAFGLVIISLIATFLLVRTDEQNRPADGTAGVASDKRLAVASGSEETERVVVANSVIEPDQPRARSRKEFWEEFSANTDALHLGEFAYDLLWADFVDSLGLSESTRNQVRDILVLSEAHNAELSDLYGSGEISNEERGDTWITPDEVAKSLSDVLPQHQVEAYLQAADMHTAAFVDGFTGFLTDQLNKGEVGILDAANRNDTVSVQAYIDSGINPNMMSLDGSNTPLVQAIMHGNLDMAESLIYGGADVNLSTMGTTPLQLAASIGNVPMVRLLIGGGANPDAEALWSASFGGYTEVVAALVTAGADVSGYDGARALENAVENDSLEMERILIDAGAQEDRGVKFARQARERERGL